MRRKKEQAEGDTGVATGPSRRAILRAGAALVQCLPDLPPAR